MCLCLCVCERERERRCQAGVTPNPQSCTLHIACSHQHTTRVSHTPQKTPSPRCLPTVERIWHIYVSHTGRVLMTWRVLHLFSRVESAPPLSTRVASPLRARDSARYIQTDRDKERAREIERERARERVCVRARAREAAEQQLLGDARVTQRVQMGGTSRC